jgi:uncharacterized DUF497 family protein
MSQIKSHPAFDWDLGNLDKNYIKHGITPNEAESIFIDLKLQVTPDIKHSGKEKRYIAFGKSNKHNVLFAAFTLRQTTIRIISAERPTKKKGVSMKNIKKPNLKKIPKFKSEKEEREFWWTHDSTQYVDFSKREHWIFPNLQLTTRPITIRLPAGLVDIIKVKANSMDIPYQSLIKQTLHERFITTS